MVEQHPPASSFLAPLSGTKIGIGDFIIDRLTSIKKAVFNYLSRILTKPIPRRKCHRTSSYATPVTGIGDLFARRRKVSTKPASWLSSYRNTKQYLTPSMKFCSLPSLKSASHCSIYFLLVNTYLFLFDFPFFTSAQFQRIQIFKYW